MKCKLGLAIAVAIVVGSVGAETLVLNDIQVYDTKSG